MTSTVPKEGHDPHGEGRWISMVITKSPPEFVETVLFQHQRFVSESRDAEPEVLWVGDSLIQNLFNSRIWDTRWEGWEK